MKKRTFTVFFICALALVSCAGNPPAGDKTSEMSTTDEKTKTVETAEKPLATEAELGIAHPMRFADDIKIYNAKDRLTEKAYEVPTKLDENHFLIVGEILAKDKLSAIVMEAKDPDAWPETPMDMVAIGYYDLEKGTFVLVRDVNEAPYPSLDEIGSMHLHALDEERLVFDVYHADTIEYFIYTMADGSLEELVRFPHTEDDWFAGIPYVTREHLYIPEPMEGGRVRTHIYDRKTLEEIKTSEAGEELKLYRGEEVYRKGGASGEDTWTDELWIGDDGFKWESTKEEWLLGFGVTADPEAVYMLSQSLRSNELEEDVTEDDRIHQMVYAPYHVVREMPADKIIAQMRGDYLDMSVGDRWIGFWKASYSEEKVEKNAYIYMPAEKIALRIDFPRPCSTLMLSTTEPYAVLYGDRDDEAGKFIIYTYEPRAEK